MSDINEKTGAGRWWEYYVLRYFLGTIVGAVIVVSYLAQNGFPVEPAKLAASEIAALAALGFAYCYIASAPGLVFHAVRGMRWRWNRGLFRRDTSRCKTNKLWQWLALFFVMGCVVTLIVSRDKWGGKGDPNWPVIGLTLCGGIWAVEIAMLLMAAKQIRTVCVFYKHIAGERSRKVAANAQLVESYRHLREHANAFEIVVFEILLAGALFTWPKHAALIAVIWSLPAVFCWLIGTHLEREFANGRLKPRGLRWRSRN